MTTATEFQTILKQFLVPLEADLNQMWSVASGMSEQEFYAYMVTAYPEVVSPHIALASDLAASWYDESAPELKYLATAAELPPVEQLRVSARWALSNPSARTLLLGSAERAFFDGARQTIAENVKQEKGARFARHASANACRFCQMLATRDVLYTSEKAATKHGTTRRRSKGKHSDDKYHDNCHCIAVMVRPGKTYQPPAYVEQWEKDYREAYKNADGAGLKALMASYRKMDAPQD